MPKGKTTPENTWQRIEYWIKRNPDKTVEECQKMLDEKLLSRRQNKPDNIEYWIKNYPNLSHEEHEKLLKNYKKENSFQCIEYWIKRNPDKTVEECQKMLDDAKKSYLAKRPDNHGENNPRHKSKTTLKERKECSPNSIEYYIKRNPNKTLEECEQLLNEFREKIKKTHTPENTSTCIEFWLAKGYSQEEAKEKLKERQTTFSLEKCIQKYGEEEGKQKFEERQQKWKDKLYKHFEENGDNRSPKSDIQINTISTICNLINIENPITEKWLYDKELERAYSYDFTYKNKMIEINGDYWHMNPNKYDINDINKNKKKTAGEIWAYDKRKIECANEYGYEVLTIWESEINKDKNDVIARCIDFITS